MLAFISLIHRETLTIRDFIVQKPGPQKGSNRLRNIISLASEGHKTRRRCKKVLGMLIIQMNETEGGKKKLRTHVYEQNDTVIRGLARDQQVSCQDRLSMLSLSIAFFSWGRVLGNVTLSFNLGIL